MVLNSLDPKVPLLPMFKKFCQSGMTLYDLSWPCINWQDLTWHDKRYVLEWVSDFLTHWGAYIAQNKIPDTIQVNLILLLVIISLLCQPVLRPGWLHNLQYKCTEAWLQFISTELKLGRMFLVIILKIQVICWAAGIDQRWCLSISMSEYALYSYNLPYNLSWALSVRESTPPNLRIKQSTALLPQSGSDTQRVNTS